MRTPTTSTQPDTPGPRRPIRVDHGERHFADSSFYLERFEQTMERAFLCAFRQAEKRGYLA